MGIQKHKTRTTRRCVGLFCKWCKMLSPVLIVCAGIVFLLMVAGNFYFLVYFQHEDDKNQAYFPKFVVHFSLMLVELTVLLLPFDVGISSAGIYHMRNMEILWAIVYMILAFMLIIVVPFTLFYYESWDPEGKSSQIMDAIKLEICTVISVLLVVLIMFFLLGTAEVPYNSFTTTFEAFNGINITSLATNTTEAINLRCKTPFDCSGRSKNLQIAVTFPVYLIALISFVGWFLFVPFCGVGLAALPMDLFADFIFRPKKLPLDQVVKIKLDLNRRATELKAVGVRIEKEGRHKKKTSKNLKIMNNLRKSVYFLEKDFERLVEAQKGINPWVYLGYLTLAIVTFAFTICWIVHICIFMFRQLRYQDPFLNNLFTELDKSFSFLGTVFYGAFSFYLVWATIKGCTKLGLRIVFFTIHPMKVGATLMNAFLFNTALILLCSVPIVQFCTSAFALYVHDTAISMIFDIQITNLKFFRYFYVNKVFLIALLIFWGLSFIYLLIFPNDKRAMRRKQKLKAEEDGWIV